MFVGYPASSDLIHPVSENQLTIKNKELSSLGVSLAPLIKLDKKNKIMECKQKENLKSCPCTYPSCPRKGICCECLRYHLANDELPACCFSKEAEKTFDRSIENFIKDRKKSND